MSDNSPGTRVAPWKPGQSGNPSGANAITKALAEFRHWADEADKDGRTRHQKIWQRVYTSALAGNMFAARLWIEQRQGRAHEMKEKVPPPKMTDESRSTLDLILATYRQRLLDGELSEPDLATLAALLMSSEKAEAEIIARILGDRKGVTTALKERAEAVIAKLEARTVEALPTAEPTPSEEKPCP